MRGLIHGVFVACLGCGSMGTPAADAGSELPLECEARCFDLHGAETATGPSFDLTVSVTGLEEWESEVVRVVVDTDGWGEDRYAVAETTIEGGAFVVNMPSVLEIDYTGIGVYVDTTRDNICSAGEPVWNGNTGILFGDMTITHVVDATTPCNINGMFDLAVPLTCRCVP